MLVPFLDILCSLIGVLVLIIVVLCVAQMQKINAVDPEDVKRAIEAQKIKKQMAEDKKVNSAAAELLKKLEQQKQELQKKKQEYDEIVKLRRLAESSAASVELNKKEEIKLLKELDDMMVETEGLKKEQPPLLSEIQALEKKIAELKPPELPVKKVVINRPTSGIESGAKLFFIECTGPSLTFYLDPAKKKTISSAPEVIVADPEFNAFLKAVRRDSLPKIVFMLREDGWKTYRRTAAYLIDEYGFQPHDLSKMAVASRGDIDLSKFGFSMGRVSEENLKLGQGAPIDKAATPVPPKK